MPDIRFPVIKRSMPGARISVRLGINKRFRYEPRNGCRSARSSRFRFCMRCLPRRVVKIWDWLRTGLSKFARITAAVRCLSQFFHNLKVGFAVACKISSKCQHTKPVLATQPSNRSTAHHKFTPKCLFYLIDKLPLILKIDTILTDRFPEVRLTHRLRAAQVKPGKFRESGYEHRGKKEPV
jgi:hypothetical protein